MNTRLRLAESEALQCQAESSSGYNHVRLGLVQGDIIKATLGYGRFAAFQILQQLVFAFPAIQTGGLRSPV